MIDIVNRIVDGLESLKGKYVEISTAKGSIASGIFVNYHHKDYFYELLMLNGKNKKRVLLFYPFSFKSENGVVTFDYRLHNLRKRCPVELVYNVVGEHNHPYLNNIVKIYEVRPDTKLS